MTSAQTKIIRIEGTLEDARNRATAIAIEAQKTPRPISLFKQGDRDMVGAVMPIRLLINCLNYNSADKGDTADLALTATNRPTVKEHWQAIASYLRNAVESGENYIIPALTLNSTGEVTIVVPEGDPYLSGGYMILPDETALFITDGQHRFLAIKKVAEDLRGTQAGIKFMNASVLTMMTIENDKSQVHQDFADAGKTKALPPSLLAVYDTRQPANHAVMEISRRVPLLNGRVDATSSTVSKSSSAIFLVNQVRQFVKGSLTGNISTNDRQFAEQAEDALSNRDSRERWIKSRVAFLNVMAEIVPDWSEIAQLSPPGGPDAADVNQKTKDIRQRQNVPMNGAFLTTIGMVSHKVLKSATLTDREESEWMQELRRNLQPFYNISWERSAEMWNGNIIVGDNQGNYRIRTQAPAVKGAAEEMLKLLDITE